MWNLRIKIYLVVCLLMFAFAALAAVPHYLTYQGVLRDNSGNLVTGTKSMAFSIYDDAAAGTQLYNQSAADISVSNGNYTVQIGPITTPTTVFSGGDRWLKVTVDGTDLSPRLKINSVAYSMRAETADSANAVADNSITASDLQEYVVLAGKIGTGEVTNEKLAGGVTGDKLASNVTGTYNMTTSGIIAANQIVLTRIATSGAGCAGTGTIIAGNPNVSVTNTNVTNSSIILITPTTRNGSHEALVPYGIVQNASFNVAFTTTLKTYPFDISFNYLIIN